MRLVPLLSRAVVAGSLTLGCAVAAISPAATSPLYTVTALRSGLENAPLAWLGRTVLVRALVQGCPFPPYTPTYDCSPASLVDGGISATEGGLPVVWAGIDTFRGSLRHIPLLDRLLPAPQVLHWGVVATYRIQLQVAPCGAGTRAPCYAAVLLDAVP
jgi:hypothetical protein